MSAKQVIDEIREYVDNNFNYQSDNKLILDLSGKALWYVLNKKLSELEQKYCKDDTEANILNGKRFVEFHKNTDGLFICTDCGHPHIFEDLIHVEGNGKVSDEL